MTSQQPVLTYSWHFHTFVKLRLPQFPSVYTFLGPFSKAQNQPVNCYGPNDLFRSLVSTTEVIRQLISPLIQNYLYKYKEKDKKLKRIIDST